MPIPLLVLLSAIAGTIYVRKVPAIKLSTRYFVGYLWFTVFIEIVGAYAPIAFFSEYRYFSFVYGTVFKDNNWVYNIYSLVSGVFYLLYFRNYIRNQVWKGILYVLAMLFGVSGAIVMGFSETFFNEDSMYVNLVGTLLILLAVILFYFELLRSELLLNLKKLLPMYVSVGVMIFYLVASPLSIFSDYFNPDNNLFVQFQSHLMLYSNIFMYTLFILGFYICSRKKKYS